MADSPEPEPGEVGQAGVTSPAEHLNEDGGSSRSSTREGSLDQGDVANAPFQHGTDPLGDRTIERRSRRPSLQIVVFAILALIFGIFFVSDLANGEWLKAALGGVVLGICGLAISRERGRGSGH